MNDPDQTENDHLRGRIAELEQVVRELRQKNSNKAPSTTVYPTVEAEPANKKRKVLVDRFAKFRYDEVMRSAHAPSLEDQQVHTSFPIRPSKPSGTNKEDEQQLDESSRKTSLSEHPELAESRRSSIAEDPQVQRSSGDNPAEPYIANVKGEGDSIIGDAAGRKAYVYVTNAGNFLERTLSLYFLLVASLEVGSC
ncbi:hypothetical protein QFC22_004246 [Naganishia vaughanmartiniae]|uniref:Uncharacterized protein n=1 Tax=Naganishia vaughanmartiniae TaxID=1424756 RepID=A0ACC2X4W6_9TREE|nr:hypothetical protein QFC22_004246 [Naganishia vaughanmartiniae]